MDDVSSSTPQDTIDRFLVDLRRLRDGRNPAPSFKQMEMRVASHCDAVSKSTLHKVYSSPALPSEKALRGYVFSLTQDDKVVMDWVKRWTRLVPEPELSSPGPIRRRLRLPPIRWIVGVCALLIVSNTITALAATAIFDDSPGQGPPATTTVGEPVRTGVDPVSTRICLEDAQIAASTRQNPEFLMKIIFSPTCNAFWGKIERTDSRGYGNTIDITVFHSADPEGPATQRAHEPDVQSAYTTMIVRRDPTDRICVTGSISIAERSIASPNPICT